MIGEVYEKNQPITGLSINPTSGQLYALQENQDGKDAVLVINKATAAIERELKLDNSLLHSADMEFDELGNMFVLDQQDQHIHRMSSGNGKTLALNASGIGGEALAYDPYSQQLVTVADLGALPGISNIQGMDILSTFNASVFDTDGLGSIVQFSSSSSGQVYSDVEIVNTTAVEEYGALSVAVSSDTIQPGDSLELDQSDGLTIQSGGVFPPRDILFNNGDAIAYVAGGSGGDPLVITFSALQNFGNVAVFGVPLLSVANTATVEKVMEHIIFNAGSGGLREIEATLKHSIQGNVKKSDIAASNKIVGVTGN